MPPTESLCFMHSWPSGCYRGFFRPAGTPTAKPNSEEKLSNEVLCWTDRLGANQMHHIPGIIKSESGDRSTRASLRC